MALAMPFRSVQRVYFDDLDALNILHNMRYLLFVERARGEMLNALGFHWHDDLARNPDKFHVVAAHTITYKTAVRGEGDLCVALQPTHLGRTSFNLAARVESIDGRVLHAESTTRLVRLDPATFKPVEWTPRFRLIMTPLVRPAAPPEP